MNPKTLEYTELKAASQENEREIYRVFNSWLAEIETMLEEQDYTLLLSFDEFEKLQEASQDGSLKLPLLLDWFRSTSQHSPRLALLFSGLQPLDEVDSKWAGHFVNVQRLKVSFLRREEASELINIPNTDFPGETLFNEHIVEEIIRLTGCHPFLVQAICSALLENLNANRGKAELKGVTSARDQVLTEWGTYFRDLWKRTSPEQGTCLAALRTLGKGDLNQIVEQSSLEARLVHRTLEDMIKRDLVAREQDMYRITIPLFSEWVERYAI